MPERTCVACREKKKADDMFRFVMKDGSALYDARRILHGRGAYVCMSTVCLSNAASKNRFSRAFKWNCKVDVSVLHKRVALSESPIVL